MTHERLDHKTIASLIKPGSSVLDLGCGNGELIDLLIREKQAKAAGIDKNATAVAIASAKNIHIIQDNIETSLDKYIDKSFDYVILNQSLTEVQDIDRVLYQALRLGKEVIVGFENYAYLKSRLELFFLGRTPIKVANTANRHFFSTADFNRYCLFKSISIIKTIYLNHFGRIHFAPNLFAVNAIYVLAKDRLSVLEKLMSTHYRFSDGGGI